MKENISQLLVASPMIQTYISKKILEHREWQPESVKASTRSKLLDTRIVATYYLCDKVKNQHTKHQPVCGTITMKTTQCSYPNMHQITN